MQTCGIDEAGRGPIIGPMVMAGVLVDEEGADSLRSIEVKDSKLLSPYKRNILFSKIIKIVKSRKIVIVEPEEIDAALKSDHLNLNWLEAHKSAEIINALKPQMAIVDSPSNNCVAYKRYLKELIHSDVELAVEHYADKNHVECAAASILAKVTRDKIIDEIKKRIGIDFGSGYLTDPKTKEFMERNFEKHKDIFRKEWAPYKKLSGGNKQKTIDDFGNQE